MTATITPENSCPYCGKKFDRASAVNNEAAIPKSGDFTLCISCGVLMAFNDDLTVRGLTLAELDTLARAIDLRSIVARTRYAILSINRLMPKN